MDGAARRHRSSKQSVEAPAAPRLRLHSDREGRIRLSLPSYRWPKEALVSRVGKGVFAILRAGIPRGCVRRRVRDCRAHRVLTRRTRGYQRCRWVPRAELVEAAAVDGT